jgi:hypothetical protein
VPAPAGLFTVSPPRITVPASGAVEVTVTGDTKAAATDGVYTGQLVASDGRSSVVSLLSIGREVESYNVTLNHIGLDGAPAR